ncbi:hypothetical protein MTR62_08540 [Novosphingobium sp. 1949]|uniref:Uncharacterized protein n=1 Tax=Novosphingobium organovorum TaxID=2930092 RepID=A0ABT0BCF6_9SPHN|nr:hypothetical protein [Novosphingobium organovorum]MCJ2182737.1 hypothetical protein [Novosphingobium organovorum]
MTVLWLGPLVTLGFITGFMISAILLRAGRLDRPVAWLAAFALPFCFAALPVALLLLFSIVNLALSQGPAAANP